MATIAPVTTTVAGVNETGDGSALLVTWTPCTEADTAAAVSIPTHSDRSVQIEGTFGGATAVLKGSNDGTNFETLNDPSNTAISTTSAKLKAVLENVVQVKPTWSGGTGQSLTFTMLFRMTNPLRH